MKTSTKTKPAAPATFEYSAVEELKYRLRRAQQEVESGKEIINKFIEDLTNSPAYAFEWGDSKYEAAAALEVNNWLIKAIEGGKKVVADEGREFNEEAAQEIIKAVKERALEETLRKARYVSKSTSASHNLIHQYVGAAWAKLNEDWN